MHSRFRRDHRSRGQGLVEFALILPVLMLVLLLVIDFGRLYFGWVNLQNTARIGANYAAGNPLAWTGSGNATEQGQYNAQIQDDATTINCTLPSPIPTPTFPDGTTNADGSANLGGRAQVSLSCGFTLITPFLGAILGNPFRLGATAVFPIKGGIVGVPIALPSPTAPPSPSPSPSATPSSTPAPCTVPLFVNFIHFNSAQSEWNRAGFTPINLHLSIGNGNYRIGTENPPGSDGTTQNCATFTLTVGP